MENSVCFIGHRKINATSELKEELREIIIKQISDGKTNFIFGDHSQFNSLCYETVTELKVKYPQIKRIKFRKDYEDTDEYTMQFLICGYEENICPKGVGSAGKAAYLERNYSMIRESDVCVFYYNKYYLPSRRRNSRRDLCDYQPKSGTAVAFLYAERKSKVIINCFK